MLNVYLNSVGTDERIDRIWTGDVGGKEWIVDLCWSEWESVDASTCERIISDSWLPS